MMAPDPWCPWGSGEAQTAELIISERCASFWMPGVSSVHRKFSWGIFIQWHGGHLYLACAVCDITTDVIFTFSNQRFSEDC